MGLRFMIFFLFGLFAKNSLAKSIDVRIMIDPDNTLALEDKPVNISCVAEASVNDVTMISISKDGNEPIVFIKQDVTNPTFNNDDVIGYKAEGDIDKRTLRKYLTLTLTQPTASDSGSYTCRLLYFDHLYILKEGTASSTLTVGYLDKTRIESILSKLVKEVSTLESKNSVSHQAMNLSARMTKLEDEDDAAFVKIGKEHSESQNQSKEIDTLKEKVTYISAFSAAMTTNFNFYSERTLIFPSVALNEGKNYDNTTGIFTASRRGLFAFHLGFSIDQTGYSTRTSIQKNGNDIATLHAYDNGNYGYSSCSAVVTLEPGDTVKVVSHGSSIGYALDKLSMFSGYLIQTI